MKKVLIILIFLALILFLYEGPLKDFVKKGKSSDIIKTLKILESCGEMVETYIIEWGKLPDVKNISELGKIISEKYEIKLPEKDSWGNFLIFKKLNSDSYEIISAGKDKKAGTEDDIVYKDGSFLKKPQNKNLNKILENYLEN